MCRFIAACGGLGLGLGLGLGSAACAASSRGGAAAAWRARAPGGPAEMRGRCGGDAREIWGDLGRCRGGEM